MNKKIVLGAHFGPADQGGIVFWPVTRGATSIFTLSEGTVFLASHMINIFPKRARHFFACFKEFKWF